MAGDGGVLMGRWGDGVEEGVEYVEEDEADWWWAGRRRFAMDGALLVRLRTLLLLT